MALPNPLFIDQNAQHLASALRMQNYAAFQGQQGVLMPEHLAVTELSTPGGEIACAPGVYVVNNTDESGAFEAYAGKFNVQETVGVSPTDSSGGRTDLVICRIENPYAVGTGDWPFPPDVLNGPYSHIRVIEDVAANINSVVAHNTDWTAIPLARITRPASTGIVEQSHITDLRSLVDLSGERITIINNPPAEAPPIAQQLWSASTPCNSGSLLTTANTSFIDWPAEANWQVPVPSWARGADVLAVFNPGSSSHAWAEIRLLIDGVATAPTMIDENMSPDAVLDVYYPVVSLGGSISIPPSSRGEVVTVKAQGRSLGGVNLVGYDGTTFTLLINFKRHPSFD